MFYLFAYYAKNMPYPYRFVKLFYSSFLFFSPAEGTDKAC